MQSFVYQGFAEQYSGLRTLEREGDPAVVRKDNMGAGTIETVNVDRRKQSKDMLFGERSRSIVSDISKKSKGSSNHFQAGKNSKLQT